MIRKSTIKEMILCTIYSCYGDGGLSVAQASDLW